MHPSIVRAEGEVVRLPSERVEARARFDEFFEEEHERLFKAPYFVSGFLHKRADRHPSPPDRRRVRL
jgi:hypothetical protein